MYAVRLRACARPLQLWKSSFQARSISSSHLPEPPPIPIKEVIVESLSPSLGPLPLEPTFTSMGLAGNSPVGWVQSAFEWLHMDLGLPWWGSIMLGTVCVRVLLTPIVVMTQRNNAHMQNHMPEMKKLQQAISDAKLTGDHMQAARAANDLTTFMKEKKMTPIKNALTPLVQFPFFISFFLGLRAMANYPVESMAHGGLWWFTDLTMPDQYYLLPVLTSLTMLATIEMGVDSAKMTGQNAQLMRYVFRAIPVVMFPFTIHFSGAILCYWVSTNTMSLIQVSLLKIPQVRTMLKIPIAIKHPPEPTIGVVENAKSAWKNMKTTKEVEGQQRNNEMQFNQAGKGPLVKTYKYDPTRFISAKRS